MSEKKGDSFNRVPFAMKKKCTKFTLDLSELTFWQHVKMDMVDIEKQVFFKFYF